MKGEGEGGAGEKIRDVWGGGDGVKAEGKI